MNNEEKILAILESMQVSIARIDKNQAILENKLNELSKRNDNVSIMPIKQSLATLERSMGRVETDISAIKDDIEIIKEDSAEVRTSVNVLLDWAERSEPVIKVKLG